MWQVRETGNVNIGFWWGDTMQRDNLEDLRIDAKIILELLSNKWGWVGIDWIDLAQDRNNLRVIVNAVMNFQVP